MVVNHTNILKSCVFYRIARYLIRANHSNYETIKISKLKFNLNNENKRINYRMIG